MDSTNPSSIQHDDGQPRQGDRIVAYRCLDEYFCRPCLGTDTPPIRVGYDFEPIRDGATWGDDQMKECAHCGDYICMQCGSTTPRRDYARILVLRCWECGCLMSPAMEYDPFATDPDDGF